MTKNNKNRLGIEAWRKLESAKYHLSLMRNNKECIENAENDFNACIADLRNVTFVLQSEFKSKSGKFQKKYDGLIKKIDGYGLTTLRTISVHEGHLRLDRPTKVTMKLTIEPYSSSPAFYLDFKNITDKVEKKGDIYIENDVKGGFKKLSKHHNKIPAFGYSNAVLFCDNLISKLENLLTEFFNDFPEERNF